MVDCSGAGLTVGGTGDGGTRVGGTTVGGTGSTTGGTGGGLLSRFNKVGLIPECSGAVLPCITDVSAPL